jgi:L-cysteine desulfidase
MKKEDKIIPTIIDILNEEIVPAEGCTEPIALALVAAKAKQVLDMTPDRLDIHVSGNIIKNVKSVVVPKSGGMVGIKVAATMGAIAGDPNKDLLVISKITPDDMVNVKSFIDNSKINIFHEKGDIKLYIKIIAYSGDKYASVEVKHMHTNITRIEKNGKLLISRACNDADFNSPLTDRKILSVELIYNLSKTIDISLIEPLFSKVIKLNTMIAEEGLQETYGVNIGSRIVANIQNGVYGDDRRNRCASYAAAGSDARMSGCPLPVMTTSGSGNQGMTASLPIIKYCELKKIDRETMIRALFLSHLLTIHIKTNVGRLSAHCGAVCAAAAVGGAIVYLNMGSLKAVSDAVVNTLGNISGLICDGAKASCAMKIATGIYTAFDSATLSYYHKALCSGDGIIGKDVEDTIKNIGILSQAGMQKTDDVILNIMTK